MDITRRGLLIGSAALALAGCDDPHLKEVSSKALRFGHRLEIKGQKPVTIWDGEGGEIFKIDISMHSANVGDWSGDIRCLYARDIEVEFRGRTYWTSRARMEKISDNEYVLVIKDLIPYDKDGQEPCSFVGGDPLGLHRMLLNKI